MGETVILGIVEGTNGVPHFSPKTIAEAGRITGVDPDIMAGLVGECLRMYVAPSLPPPIARRPQSATSPVIKYDHNGIARRKEEAA